MFFACDQTFLETTILFKDAQYVQFQCQPIGYVCKLYFPIYRKNKQEIYKGEVV